MSALDFTLRFKITDLWSVSQWSTEVPVEIPSNCTLEFVRLSMAIEWQDEAIKL